MPAITAVNITKSYGARTVLTDVSVTVGRADRIGVVGANGTGKSTLLRILAGAAPDGGYVTRHPRLAVGLLPQELPVFEGTAWEIGLDAVADVLALRDRWNALATAISERPHDGSLLEEYGSALDALERMGGFHIEATVRAVLSGLGLSQEIWNRPAGSLSGGEQTRLNLGRVLLRHPDVLLLDEPTNHLDVPALQWLEEFLGNFPGAVVAASHDRRFLDVVARRVIELDAGGAREYSGNYSDYAAAKARGLAAQADAFARHRDEVERLRAYVQAQLQRAGRIQAGPKRGRDHYGRVAKKVARGAAAGRQRLARVEARGPQKLIVPDAVAVRFDAAGRPGDAVAQIRAVEQRYGQRTVLAGVTLILRRGDRVGVVGINGSGKTSLLRLLAGIAQPSAGEVWVGPGVRAGYLAQDTDHLRSDRSVIDVALDAGMSPAQSRALLAALLFRGDRVFQSVSSLSGGERTRLALFDLISRHTNLLLLDEPTNHLDLPSRERLEDALDAYNGTLVIATHDRYLLDRLCAVLWVLDAGTVRVRDGNFSAAAPSKSADGTKETE